MAWQVMDENDHLYRACPGDHVAHLERNQLKSQRKFIIVDIGLRPKLILLKLQIWKAKYSNSYTSVP